MLTMHNAMSPHSSCTHLTKLYKNTVSSRLAVDRSGFWHGMSTVWSFEIGPDGYYWTRVSAIADSIGARCHVWSFRIMQTTSSLGEPSESLVGLAVLAFWIEQGGN